MAGQDTRLLLLGAVATFEPVNGYQIRRELTSWQVDEWAHLNPGSIYSGLTTLTKRGHLVRHDLVDGTREVAVYEISDEGRTELERLIAVSLERVDLYDAVAFHAAFGFLALLDRDRALEHLERRLRALDEAIEQTGGALRVKEELAPPNAVLGLALQQSLGATQRGWLVEVLELIRDGGLSFAGESMSWQPRDDDPGWQMVAERARYRTLLAR